MCTVRDGCVKANIGKRGTGGGSSSRVLRRKIRDRKKEKFQIFRVRTQLHLVLDRYFGRTPASKSLLTLVPDRDRVFHKQQANLPRLYNTEAPKRQSTDIFQPTAAAGSARR